MAHMALSMTPRAKIALKRPKVAPRWALRWPQDALKEIELGPKMEYSVFYETQCFPLVFSNESHNWRLNMAPFLEPCDINDMTSCHLQLHAYTCASKLANMIRHKRTCGAPRVLRGCSKGAQEANFYSGTKVSAR